ncbi:MAG TPA: flagellar basal-body MS-ring/collar protein FliF [Clostridia bacterium]
MPEALGRMVQQFKEYWSNIDKPQKRRIYITSAILVIVMTVSIIFLTWPNYMTLIRNGDTKEIGEMVKVLNDKKIWNRVENGGSNIVINSKDNSAAQAALVQSGYPKTSGMTFDDAFNMIKLNTTESDKKKLWEQYTAQSLNAKLKALDNVEYASVTLATPEKSPFVGDTNGQKPTANVVVKPKGELTAKQVQGIVMMVASSVEGLNQKDITVVDNNLNPLNTADDDLTAPGSQYEMKLKVKKELEAAVRDHFTGQFDSFDAIRVNANPVLDFNSESVKKKEITNPSGMNGTGALISSDDLKEKVDNGSTSGTPGVNSNPGTQAATGATAPTYQTSSQGNGSYDKSQSKKNFEYNETLSDQQKALGAMDFDKSSISVSLLYGTRVTDDSKLTTEFIDQVKKDVSAATGISASNVLVSKYKVAPAAAEKKSITDTMSELFNTYGMFALILILMIGLIIFALPKRKNAANSQLALEGAGNIANGHTGESRFSMPDSEEVPEIDVEERNEVKKQIDRFVQQKPEAVAQLLRNWLSDEWE